MSGKKLLIFLFFMTLGWVIFGCSIKRDESEVQAKVTITKIIEKATKQPIKQNKITMRWETPDGEILKIKTYENRSSLTVTMPADGTVRLFIRVESPGYHPWENAIRMKFDESKPVTIPVEMQKTGIDL